MRTVCTFAKASKPVPILLSLMTTNSVRHLTDVQIFRRIFVPTVTPGQKTAALHALNAVNYKEINPASGLQMEYILGHCVGPSLGVFKSITANRCLQLCRDSKDCQWFTFHYEDSACTLTTECQFVDHTCKDTCVYGEATCQVTQQGEHDILTNGTYLKKIHPC